MVGFRDVCAETNSGFSGKQRALEKGMEHTDLLIMQQAYKRAVEDWVKALRSEEDLALVNPTVAQVDIWEGAHFKEEEGRNRAKQAKKDYEDALRLKLFAF
jgi:hypothetical protein